MVTLAQRLEELRTEVRETVARRLDDEQLDG